MSPDWSGCAEIDIRRAIVLLRRYKIDSTGELRNTQKRNRDCATDELRSGQNIDYAHYMMILELIDSVPPASRNRRGEVI